MTDIVFIALLAYAFLVGVKLIVRRKGHLRIAGAVLAFLLAPAIALERFKPGALGNFTAFDTKLDVLYVVTSVAGTLFFIELAGALLSFLRVRKKGEDFLQIHRALFRMGLLLIVLPIVLKIRYGDELNFTRVLQSAAVGSIILGLALQNTLSNLFAGLGIEAENMMQQGEFIQVGQDGPRGIVTGKTWRSTRILTNDGLTVFIPNNEIGKLLLINYDRPTRDVALRTEVGVDYEAPPIVVKDVIEQAIRSEPDVLPEPPVQVWAKEFQDSAIKYVARFWIRGMRGHDQIRDRVNTAIWYAFRERGIAIPFPVRTLHLVDKEQQEKLHDEDKKRRGDIAAFLSGAEPFRTNCNAADLRFLAQNARLEHYDPEVAIVRKGARSDAMFVIRDGTCSVVLPDGKRIELKPPQYFGEIGILRGATRTADVVAGSGGATVLRFGPEAVRVLLLHHEALRADLDRTGDLRLQELKAHDAAAARTPAITTRNAIAAVWRIVRPW